MKKLVLAATAVLTLSMGGAAFAADMRAPIRKGPPPPPPPPVWSWTGCYIAGGGGYGMYNIDRQLVVDGTVPTAIPTGTVLIDTITHGGRGWFGTAQVGCDVQLGPSWVIGAFADVDFSDLKGQHEFLGVLVGEQRLEWSWAVGGRIGWLVNPQLLTYFTGGYTRAQLEQVNFNVNLFPLIGTPTALILPERDVHGWFLGGGVEYALGWFPGLFWKTEYRFADYRRLDASFACTAADLVVCGAAGPVGIAARDRLYVQTVRSELVWRFNFGGPGPVAARY